MHPNFIIEIPCGFSILIYSQYTDYKFDIVRDNSGLIANHFPGGMNQKLIRNAVCCLRKHVKSSNSLSTGTLERLYKRYPRLTTIRASPVGIMLNRLRTSELNILLL